MTQRKVDLVQNILLVFVIILLSAIAIIGRFGDHEKSTEEKTSEPSIFDVSALETWSRGDATDTIRMVSATHYGVSNDGKNIVKDELGQTWEVSDAVEEYDFLLLWISNNNTSDTADDVVIKVWKEMPPSIS